MKFTESHEWVELQDEVATVGITKYAQKELGDIVYVELPKVSAVIKKDEEVCILESTKAAVDIYSPLSGTIVEVNESLKKYPELINDASESLGWIYKIRVANKEEYHLLLEKEM